MLSALVSLYYNSAIKHVQYGIKQTDKQFKFLITRFNKTFQLTFFDQLQKSCYDFKKVGMTSKRFQFGCIFRECYAMFPTILKRFSLKKCIGYSETSIIIII